MTPLDALRIFGPISTPEVHRRLGGRLADTLGGLQHLRNHGWAWRDAEQRWDVTDAGRQLFAARIEWAKEVAAGRRRDAKCQGVRS